MALSKQRIITEYNKDTASRTDKYDRLRKLDVFVLDNSIRESTVGQLRGHTMESKRQIYEEVKKCGFKNIIVASPSHMTRVDDEWMKELGQQKDDLEHLWVFSEITRGSKNKVPDTETVPVGIEKIKAAGLQNVIFELDLGDYIYNFRKFTVQNMCNLLKKWIVWSHANLHQDAKTLVNIRDLADVMPVHPERVYELVSFLATLPHNLRPIGVIFEDPMGKSLPEECGGWAKFIRRVMDEHKWEKGHLLAHIHEKFGLCDYTALQVLMDGADGIWASVAAEGAAMGHASSCVTLMNLIRLGNKKVLQRYNCVNLRKAAINVTKTTTGRDPPNKQPLYGPRALDLVFGLNPDDFDLASFFGEKPMVRISTMASKEMIRARLINLFGEDSQFTLELTQKMRELILEDLQTGRKEEYMSIFGLALLFDRAGGSLNKEMRDAIDKVNLRGPHAKNLLAQVREIWDTWDLEEAKQGDDMLEFDSFYNGFMAPYFACYRCSDTKKAMLAIDMDADGSVDWNEFETYLKWALHQYPNIEDVQELLDVTFRKGIMPAMQDEVLKNK